MSHAPTPRIVPTPEQQMELVGEAAFPDEWAADVAARSGDTREFQESARRTAVYTTDDWRQIMDDEKDICDRLAAAMSDGLPPDSDMAMNLAEEHRGGLRRWFFDCSPEAHVAFADTFDADERMRSTFEGVAPGLTEYLRQAIHANAERADRAGKG